MGVDAEVNELAIDPCESKGTDGSVTCGKTETDVLVLPANCCWTVVTGVSFCMIALICVG